MYEGFMLDDKKHGKGKEISMAGIFEGTFIDDEKHGKGTNERLGCDKKTVYYKDGLFLR
jgi:hypothetical protein